VATIAFGLVVEVELGAVADEVEQLHASAATVTKAMPRDFTEATLTL
jgi:hypothetical protein